MQTKNFIDKHGRRSFLENYDATLCLKRIPETATVDLKEGDAEDDQQSN